jgi:hypothetical protein
VNSMPQASHPEMMPLILRFLRGESMSYESAVRAVAIGLKLPSSRVHGFISQFPELAPRDGKVLLRVCNGPACAARGADRIYQSLRGQIPESVMIVKDPGLIAWHDSPAVCIDYPDGGKTLIELSGPEDVGKVLEAIKKGEKIGPVPRVPSGEGLGVSWLEEEDQDLQHAKDAIAEFASNPGEALDILENSALAETASVREIISAARSRLSGSPGAELMICDMAGEEAENSIDYLTALRRPGAVVLGAALGAILSGAQELVFYVPFNDEELRKAIAEAVASHLTGIGIEATVFEGPVNVPSSYEIGRAAVVEGRMLWEAASLYAAVEPSPRVIVLAASSALRLLRISMHEEDAWIGGMIDPAGNHGLVLAGGFHPRNGVKAVQAGSRLLPADEAAGERLDGTSQLVLLDSSHCMVEWAHYLALRAEDSCCGGCIAGRTAPAAAAGLIREVLDGSNDGELLARLSATLGSAPELALCPRLAEGLGPVLSTLEHFKGEFETHALHGACNGDSRSTSASPQTEER